MWGDPNVTHRLLLSNDQTPWGNGGYPVSQKIKRGDILKNLYMIMDASMTATPGTGTIAADVNGPYNSITQLTAGPSNSSKFVQVSGWSLYLISLAKLIESTYNLTDANIYSPVNQDALGNIFSGRATTGTAVDWRFALPIPVSQRLRSVSDVGMWQLAEESLNLEVSVTPNSGSASTPYNIYSTVGGAAPYIVSGNATVTIANPTFDIVRELYKNPLNDADYPDFDFVSVWKQDSFTNPNSKAPYYKFPANSGLLVRAIIDTFDATAGNGFPISTYFAAADALAVRYGTSDTKEQTSGYERRIIGSATEFGFEPPQGVFLFDWLGGRDLVLQDAINTALLLDTRLELDLGATPPNGSRLNVIYQLLQPLVVTP